ncbi:EF0163 family protein [Enterococcus faecium]|uniref:EF0163 family protein n=1 Tax=Enterococcus faecium TaxID=1352 RepID=UPI00338D3DC7
MNTKKKIKFISLFLIVCTGLAVFYFIQQKASELPQQNKEAIEMRTYETSESNTRNTPIIQIAADDSELQQKVNEQEEQLQTLIHQNEEAIARKETIHQLLQNFGKHWLNYDSIYQRNQSVRDWLTEEAIENYSIDFDPKVEFESSGKITLITQSMFNENSYLVMGEESARGSWNKVIIELELIEDEDPKINHMTVNYMRQDD